MARRTLVDAVLLVTVCLFFTVWLCFLLSVDALYSCAVMPSATVGLFSGLFLYVALFVIDASSIFFLCVVLFVGLMTQIYGIAYMRSERQSRLFVGLLLLFVVSMCVLVLANSFVVFFVAWELIGLCSFVLIGFWSTRVFSIGAAVKAVSLNRIPDAALLISMCACFMSGGISDFSSLGELGCDVWLVGVWIQLGFIFAAAAKSAQVGFTGWLLSAMEGPTPVSALMHAATLVTAGVILLVRCGSVFSSAALCGIFVVGLVTALLSGISAAAENDLKQIVALSTSSQMGLAFMFVGAGDSRMAFLHIAVHAVFKSLLFWGVGVINHYSDHQYAAAFRFCVGFYMKLVIFIAAFALLGTPFMSGFYSKEFILSGTLLCGSVFVLVCLCQVLSVFYTCRLVWLCLFFTGRLLPKFRGPGFIVGIPTIFGSWFAVVCGAFVFFEARFLADFSSVWLVSAVRQLRGGGSIGVVVQFFIVLPWLAYVVLTSVRPRRLVGGCRVALRDALMRSCYLFDCLFDDDKQQTLDAGDTVCLCLLVCFVGPALLGLGAVGAVRGQFRRVSRFVPPVVNRYARLYGPVAAGFVGLPDRTQPYELITVTRIPAMPRMALWPGGHWHRLLALANRGWGPAPVPAPVPEVRVSVSITTVRPLVDNHQIARRVAAATDAGGIGGLFGQVVSWIGATCVLYAPAIQTALLVGAGAGVAVYCVVWYSHRIQLQKQELSAHAEAEHLRLVEEAARGVAEEMARRAAAEAARLAAEARRQQYLEFEVSLFADTSRLWFGGTPASICGVFCAILGLAVCTAAVLLWREVRANSRKA